MTAPPDNPGPARDALAGATRWTGGRIAPGAVCVLAANPGPMTLDGTNTWLLWRPGSARCVVVDPGPDDQDHLRAVLDCARGLDLRVETVLLTHGHDDHAAGAAAFAGMAGGIGVRALDPAHRLGAEGLADRQVIDIDGLAVAVVGTPGHTADSMCFVVDAGTGPAVLTGDTVLGRGTSVVAHPGGRLADYLRSLRRLTEMADELSLTAVWPGHGPALGRPSDVLSSYLEHRRARLEQVRAAVDSGARTPSAVVEVVYADVPRNLWAAAELSVQAQLEYLDAGAQEPPPGA